MLNGKNTKFWRLYNQNCSKHVFEKSLDTENHNTLDITEVSFES